MKPVIDTIFVDMDGVLCDFIGPAVREFNRPDLAHKWPVGEWDLVRVLGVTVEHLWAQLDRISFWTRLPKLPWCDALLAACSARAEWFVLTDTRSSPVCAYAKHEWLHAHIAHVIGDRQFTRCHQTAHKQHLAGPRRLLIDDSDRNVEQFIAAGGQAILMPQRWNSRHHLAGKEAFQQVLLDLDAFDFSPL